MINKHYTLPAVCTNPLLLILFIVLLKVTPWMYNAEGLTIYQSL